MCTILRIKWIIIKFSITEVTLYHRKTQQHPVHSLILDIDDKMWVKDGYLTEQEMKEIKDTHCPKDPEVSTHINEYLDGYVGKVYII